MRIALGIEYNGSLYSGWQKQKHSVSIQQFVELALSRVADCEVNVICAGRTDAGVHAMEQVIHFDTEIIRPINSWALGANTHLPFDIRVLWGIEVTGEFHARFSAEQRSYQYVILNRLVRPGFLHKLVTHEYRPLEIGLMQQAANYLIGKHNFNSYRAKHCQSKTPVRTMHQLRVSRNDNFVVIEYVANAFLHHMVRNISGVLMTIGSAEKPPSWAQEILQLQNRQHKGVTASPDGLYLTSVQYPEKFSLPQLTNRASIW
ncbi:tRNA pseudouridine(38-40) synthase [hydrothermal vent metagenome]|uniref:tRNA pseudouridine(38-40) synthase n=1 Tax=hydrothermal vent metagenome TaxID=652676 RepID=A0A3B1AGN7_9ZZZZ